MLCRWRGSAGAAAELPPSRALSAVRRRHRPAFCPAGRSSCLLAEQICQGAPLRSRQGGTSVQPALVRRLHTALLSAPPRSPLKMLTMLKLRPGSSDDLAIEAHNRFI